MKAKLPKSDLVSLSFAKFRLVLLSLASLEFCFASLSFSFSLFLIFFISCLLETLNFSNFF
jgi:hypothetical protein